MKHWQIAAPLLVVAGLWLGCEGSGLGASTAVADAAPDALAGLDLAEPAVATSRLTVLDRLGFAPEEPEGYSEGFDLDGLVSTASDPGGCYQPDLVGLDGVVGVDNTFGTLLPFFAVAGIGAAEVLLQSTIEEGGILLMLEVGGIDDPLNDDQVSLTVRTGQGKPLIATDGLLLPGQTFHLRPDSPDSTTESGRITDGVLTAGPLDTWLRVQVLGDEYELPIHGAYIRARLTEDGGLSDGIIGAGIAIVDLLKIGALNSDVLDAMEFLFAAKGDLAPNADGECQQVSATLKFNAVSAYLFDEPLDR